jgi:hypothetical protein
MANRPLVPHALRVADEVWIATALLHREHSDRDDFTIQEISRRAQQQAAEQSLRPGFITTLMFTA